MIEDNATNRELMVYLLKAFGYTTIEAGDGITGLEMAQAQLPDFIVCDVQLPKLDGYGVVKALKAEATLRDMPVVAVTALAMVGDRDRILQAGFDGYVSKPITPETFVSELGKFLPEELHSRFKPVTSRIADTTPHATEPPPASRGTILAIDDVAANLEFIRSTLRPLGFEVLTADKVETAFAIGRERRPDLLLCDLHMQPESGLDLLDRARIDPVLRDVPVLIISSTGTGSLDEGECLRRGAFNFIRRPIEPEALLAEIAEAMEEARQP